ncbi:MAG: hypothetical protein KA310_03515 [Pseudomonadales bacterium]|nr:hypothetical protein [Pseudomonadales bacterium]
MNDAARHHVAAALPTSTRADPTPPRLPRAKPVQSDVERALERIDGTLVDLRAEVADWTGQQKRGNRISLEVQGDVRRLEKKVDAGFKTLRAQNDQILKLLLKRLPK